MIWLHALESELADMLNVHAASNGPANYQFNYSASPFTFAVARADSNGEALFNTVGTRLVIKVSDIQAKDCLVIPVSSDLNMH